MTDIQDWSVCSRLLWPLVCVVLLHLVNQTSGPAKSAPPDTERHVHKAFAPLCNVSYTHETLSALKSSVVDLELDHSAKAWLRPWSRHRHGSFGITTAQVDALFEYVNSTNRGAIRFVVLNGRPIALPIWHVGRMHYEARLEHWYQLFDRIAERFYLPENLDIVVSTEDQPLIAAGIDTASFAPLFVYATIDPGFYDIPIPTSEYFAKLERNDLRQLVAEQKWEDRKSLAIWRGSPTGGWFASYDWYTYPRSQLVNVSMHHPDIIDAKYLPCAPGQCADDVWGLIQEAFPTHTDDKHFTMEDYVHHKYLIDIDGNAWSSRFVDLLRTGCIIFKVRSDFEEYFDSFVIPYKHYIPVAADSSDLPEKVRWALDHDAEMKEMSRAAQEIFHRFIGNGVWEGYANVLIHEYSKLLPPRPSNFVLGEYREKFKSIPGWLNHLHKIVWKLPAEAF